MCAHRAAPLNPLDADGPVLRDTLLIRAGRRVLLRYMASIVVRLWPFCIILREPFYGTSRAHALGGANASDAVQSELLTAGATPIYCDCDFPTTRGAEISTQTT